MINSKHSGFTLIELMVVVAIIGILAAIGIPLYNVHIAKSKMTSAYAEIAPGKLAIDEAINNNTTISGGLSNYGLNSLSKNCAFTALTSTNTSTPSWIQCTLRNAPPQLSGVTIRLTRTVPNGVWECTTTADVRYKPNGCN